MMVGVGVRLEIEAEKFQRKRVDYTAICGRSSRVWGSLRLEVRWLLAGRRIRQVAAVVLRNRTRRVTGSQRSPNWSTGLRWMGLVAIAGTKNAVTYAY
jgi:hypothetical protein